MLLLRDSQEAGRPQACACIESQRRRDIVTGMKLFYTARHSFCQDPPCCPLCTACSGAHRSLPGPRRYPSSTCTSLITWPGLRQQAAPGQLAQLAGRKRAAQASRAAQGARAAPGPAAPPLRCASDCRTISASSACVRVPPRRGLAAGLRADTQSCRSWFSVQAPKTGGTLLER